MDALDIPKASMLQSQAIRTGSTAKRRWLRFVCWQAPKVWQRVVNWALAPYFSQRWKMEAPAQKPFRGREPKTLIVYTPMTSSTAVIQSYFHLRSIRFSLYLITQHFSRKRKKEKITQTAFVFIFKPISLVQAILLRNGAAHGLEIQSGWCDSSTSRELSLLGYRLDHRWLTHSLSLKMSSKCISMT